MAENPRTARSRPSRTPRPPRNTAADPAEKDAKTTSDDLGISPPAEKRRSPQDRKLAGSIASTYQAVGMGLIGVGMRLEDNGLVGTGTNTVNAAETLAEAWLDLADQNPAVKKALKKFTEVSAAGTVIGLHVTLLIPILVDRQVIPAPMAAMAGFAAGPTPNGNGAES